MRAIFRNLDWHRLAFAIVATEYFAAALIGSYAGFNYSIPFISYFTIAAVIVASATVAILVLNIFRATLSRSDVPFDGGRFLDFAIGVLLVGSQVAVLNWLKIELPLTVGFRSDVALANFDRTLFGTDPWKLSHAFLGWATPAIDRLYVSWGAAKFTTLFVVLALPPSPTRSRALLAYFLIAAGGSLGQYLAPSAGPVFYDAMGLGSDFTELPISPWVETARSYLWADYLRGGGDIGTGISAFPSLHVAIALWIALVVQSFLPRLSVIAWAYFVVIFVGSVHLGWHYSADSLASVVLAVLAWQLAALRRPDWLAANGLRKALHSSSDAQA